MNDHPSLDVRCRNWNRARPLEPGMGSEELGLSIAQLGSQLAVAAGFEGALLAAWAKLNCVWRPAWSAERPARSAERPHGGCTVDSACMPFVAWAGRELN